MDLRRCENLHEVLICPRLHEDCMFEKYPFTKIVTKNDKVKLPL